MKKDLLLIIPTHDSSIGGIVNWSNQLISILTPSKVNFTHINTLWSNRKQVGYNLFDRFYAAIFESFGVLLRLIIILIKRERYVTSHSTSSGSYGLIKDILFGALLIFIAKKRIIHFRFGKIPSYFERKGLFYCLFKFSLVFYNEVLVLDMKSHIRVKSLGVNVHLVPNFIVYDDVNISLSDRTIDFVFIGHVSKEKGIYELIESYKKFRNFNDFTSKLHILGSYNESIKTYIHNELGGNVVLLGHSSKEIVKDYLLRSKFLVLPSYSEGFPNVILEAFMYGAVVLASDVGNISDILSDYKGRKCGYLVEPRDANSLLEAMQSAMNDYEIQNIKEAARLKLTEKYTSEIVLEQLKQLWNYEER